MSWVSWLCCPANSEKTQSKGVSTQSRAILIISNNACETSKFMYQLINMFFIWSNESCGTNKRDEAGTEQPVLGSQCGTADAAGCAERLDSICSSVQNWELDQPDQSKEVADGTRAR